MDLHCIIWFNSCDLQFSSAFEIIERCYVIICHNCGILHSVERCSVALLLCAGKVIFCFFFSPFVLYAQCVANRCHRHMFVIVVDISNYAFSNLTVWRKEYFVAHIVVRYFVRTTWGKKRVANRQAYGSFHCNPLTHIQPQAARFLWKLRTNSQNLLKKKQWEFSCLLSSKEICLKNLIFKAFGEHRKFLIVFFFFLSCRRLFVSYAPLCVYTVNSWWNTFSVILYWSLRLRIRMCVLLVTGEWTVTKKPTL